MNFLSEEHRMWAEQVDRFMDRQIGREYIRNCDTNRDYPYEAYASIAKEGWLRLLIPEDHGGLGGTIFDYALMCEGLSKYGFDFATGIMVSTFTAMNLVKFGTDAQKEKYLEPFMNGDIKFCISISEPTAGSDAANTKTRATPNGDGFLIKGQKLWCSGAGAKNAVLAMLVRSDPDATKHEGLSVFLIPNDSPGLEVRRLPTLSRRATGTNEVFCDDVPAGRDQLMGELGGGWNIIVDHLELERIAVSAGYVGNAQQAVTDALQYANERVQFDRPIFDFQVIRHMLADMQTKVDASRLLVYRAADMAARGESCSKEVSMAKLYASETLQEVTRMGMQILGGHSMLPEADMERYFREGIQSTIGGGTSQIQRTIISKGMRL